MKNGIEPLVTVLVPVYNVERFLRECLDSIINQTYKNLQVVALNDGSTDNSGAILDEYAHNDARLTVIHRANEGVSSARNELLKHIKGDYFIFIDSDDWIEPDMIADMLALINSTGADIALCDLTSESESKTIGLQNINIWDHHTIVQKFLSHKELTGSLGNKLIACSVLQETISKHNAFVAFPSGITYGEDALFVWNLIPYVNKMVVIKNGYYHYRMNDHSISHSTPISKKIDSIKQVWGNICSSIDPKINNYQLNSIIANARHGAELTLVAFSAAKSKMRNDDEIQELRTLIRKKLFYMTRSSELSISFKAYAIAVAMNWNLAKQLVNITNR